MEDKTKEVDGVSYVFSYLPPSKALPLLATLTKTVLAPAGSFISGLMGAAGGSGFLDVDLSKANLTEACEKLAANLDPTQLTSIAKELLTTVTLSPSDLAKQRGSLEVTLDRDFTGRLPALLKVLAYALEVNFGDFFSGLGGLAAKGKALLSTLGPRQSAGKSGE